MISAEQLTPAQRAVVQHGDGPAAVLAVPGAGKSTAVVHRVRTLVEERGVPPARILVSSFNRATVDELSAALRTLGFQGVDTRTLHGLGRALLQTHRNGDGGSGPDPDQAAYRLARCVLREHADEQGLHPADLDLSVRDLVDRVAAWKQQLAYLNPASADLPEGARGVAQTVDPADEDLRTLCRHFEAHRRREGWITYPDMLRGGWEALARDDALRSRVQKRYDHVIVDEFQDVGRAQFYLLDHLTAAHRNYMVVGDDDQCIYRWRGANPSLLLDFSDRYGAEEYRLQTSFRLPAGPLVLANAVIDENEQRRPKRLRLTQGVGQACTLLEADGAGAVADRLAETVERLRAERQYALDEMVVLVRTYGQTPPIERALIDRSVPYRVRGHAPFYRRRSVQTLLRYLYWAVLERRRRERSGFDDETTARQYADRFASIINRPTRYVQRGRVDFLRQQVLETHNSVLSLLEDQRTDMADDTAERVGDFVAVATALVDALDAPAARTLKGLVEALDYETALRERSPSTARGEMRVRTTRALVRYAEAFDSSPALLRGIRSLAARRNDDHDKAALELRSIHRAKGAEWPVVLLPGCTQGTLPLEAGPDEDVDLEEERRLFYVALTRTQDRLYLGRNTAEPPSPFLDEAGVSAHLPRCTALRDGLRRPPRTLSDRTLTRLCHAVGELDLDDYFHNWWRPPAARATALRARLQELKSAVEEARTRLETYRDAQSTYEEARREARANVRRDLESLRDTVGSAPLRASLVDDAPHLPAGADLTFDWAEDDGLVRVQWREREVAVLDPFGAVRLDARTLLEMPWPEITATVDGVRRGQLRFSVDWEATEGALLAARQSALSPPDPPEDLDRLLTSSAVWAGRECLLEALRDCGEGDRPSAPEP